MAKSKKKMRVPGPHMPAMVPLAQTVTDLDPSNPPSGFRYGMTGEPEKNFAEFVGQQIAQLETRAIGNWEHLAGAYLNAFTAGRFVPDMAHHIDARKGRPCPRANAAGVNIMSASNILHSALLLHLRPEPFNDRAAMVLVRTALECTGRAACIAQALGDEVQRWDNNEQLTTGECNNALAAYTRAANPAASEPATVYAWLCNFMHMNAHGVKHFFDGPATKHEDTYAALAYVAWATAVAAERVVGATQLAKWPVMPTALPW